jgi:hypothetical protein
MNVLLCIVSNAGNWMHSRLRRGLLIFLQDPDTRCILHLISGSGTTVCTLHLAVPVLILLHDVLTMSNLSLNASALL